MADHSMLAQVRAQQSWHQVTATLTHPRAQRVETTASDWFLQPAQATWTVGGRTHSGQIPLALPPGKDGKVSVWVDAAGQLTGAPSANANLHLVVGLAVFSALLAVGVFVFLAGVATRLLMNRRRMADWDTAWRAVGPQWSRQL